MEYKNTVYALIEIQKQQETGRLTYTMMRALIRGVASIELKEESNRKAKA